MSLKKARMMPALAAAMAVLSLPLRAAHGEEDISVECVDAFVQCDTELYPGENLQNDARCAKALPLCQNTPPVPRFYGDEGGLLIDRAFRALSARTEISVRTLRGRFAPVIVSLPKMRCVGLVEFPRETGNVTMCFDRSGNEVLDYGW